VTVAVDVDELVAPIDVKAPPSTWYCTSYFV
jgi:hypothetical protein